MKRFSNLGSDSFAAFQIIWAYVFTVPQLFRMFVSTTGMTINWLLCALIFIVLNLILSISSYRKVNNRKTAQAIVIYANWVLLLIPLVTVAFIKCPWTGRDSVIFSLIMAAALSIGLWCAISKTSLTDPVVKGLFVGLFRAVPHLFMAYCIFSAGSSRGIAFVTMIAANVTALCRVTTLLMSCRETHWEKGIRASFLSECANEGSWMVTSVMWLVYR